MDDQKKLNNLQAQIDALKAKHEPKAAPKGSQNDSMSAGLRAGTELVGAIGGAALIGYGLDRWLGTKPWIMIALTILGVGAGFVNVWRTTQNAGSAVGYKNLHDGQKKSLAKDAETLK